MANWTTDNIPDLSGKVFIVTGANSGLGYESALALAEKGGTVIMACRSLERGSAAEKKIKEAVPEADLELMELDLASLASIQAFAKAYENKFDKLDVLMNNAGISGPPRWETPDGFEAQFGVNHLGTFALTGLILDPLLATPGSRVVTVSSRMHANAVINWDDLMSEGAYDKWEAYSQSKLANVLFSFELNRRLGAIEANTTAIAVHPGMAATNWVNSQQGLQKFIIKIIGPLMMQSAAQGALSQLYAAVDENAKGGGYYGPDGDKKGYPMETKAGDAAYNEADARRLWQISEELTSVKYAQLAE